MIPDASTQRCTAIALAGAFAAVCARQAAVCLGRASIAGAMETTGTAATFADVVGVDAGFGGASAMARRDGADVASSACSCRQPINPRPTTSAIVHACLHHRGGERRRRSPFIGAVPPPRI
ncbi:hypothetical protein GCM10009105_00720 [Dokdonella soli]|uniref:Secreted protein n=1 Tax=Dokdonella soli TaxID=529810 RepID=A0ABP3TKZ4_9GAMM